MILYLLVAIISGSSLLLLNNPADELIDFLPDEFEGLQTDAPLIEYADENPDYVMRVTQIYYDIHGSKLQFEWTNHNANPDHFRQEMEQLPSVEPPDFLPDLLTKHPIGKNTDGEFQRLGFYFEDLNVVFTVNAIADTRKDRQELLRRGFRKLDVEKLSDWSGFDSE